MKKSQIEKKLLESLHEETGWGNPLRPHCECETLYVRNITELSDGAQIVDFRYIFDEDGFSQYDKTHVFEGTITITSESVIALEMEQVHDGVATNMIYEPKSKKI